MSVNSVQLRVKQALDGLPSPYFNNMSARIAPPSIDDIGDPKAYIWATSWDDKQFTFNRGRYDQDNRFITGSGGNRKATYEIDIWVAATIEPDDPNADEAFPILIDAVMNAIKAIPLVSVLTDPTTAEATGMLAIGESFRVQQAPEYTTADQRYVRLGALIKTTVVEFGH